MYRLASKLLSFCGYEISNIESCFDCFENMHVNPNGRSLACSQPHLVLWIQLNKNHNFWAAQKGYLYWPAKMTSTDEINAKVIFFDFIYLKKTPKSILKKQSMTNSKDVDIALKVKTKFCCNFLSFYRNFFFNTQSGSR